MLPRLSSPKDFWAGLIYIGVALLALVVGADYRTGTAGRMGPGYFPKALAGILLVLGLVAVIRGFTLKGGAIGRVMWKPLVLCLLAVVLFGLLITTVGLLGTLPLLVLVSAAASQEFRLDLKATAGLAAITGLCALVFVKGLGVPMPLIGPWLEPWVEPLVRAVRSQVG